MTVIDKIYVIYVTEMCKITVSYFWVHGSIEI